MKAKLTDLFLKMNHIRFFEEKVAYFFSRGMIHGTTHLYVGEEATAVGACAALKETDLITSTHRGHGHCIAKGIDLNKMMAELLGKESGYCKGKGGSMHIADLSRGNLGANGIVGGGPPIATGAALAEKLRGSKNVVCCFFGDGAINEGSFHEAVNMASVWDLPVIFICENNQYGMSMSIKRSANLEDLSQRAVAYGIPGVRIDGNDIFSVEKAVEKARKHVLKKGPYLIVAETYRFKGHSKSDANRYRTKEEIQEWQKRDPLILLSEAMIKDHGFSREKIDELTAQAQKEIDNAVAFAEKESYPSIETIADDVYAPAVE